MPIGRVSAIRPVASGPRALRPLAVRSALPAGRAAALIDAKMASLGDWRGETLGRLRRLIREASPEIVEDWAWDGPAWRAAGIVCIAEIAPQLLRLSFARGAVLADPAGLFNAKLEGSVRRAIELREGQLPDEGALQALVRAAIALNQAAQG